MSCTDYFGLSEPPFSATPDPRFLYHHSSFNEAMATLRYGIEARKGFVLITGKEGAGKTTLLRALLNSLGPDIRTAFIFDTPVSFTPLLQTVLKDLGLPDIAEDRSVMTGRLNQFLIEQLKERRTVCLLIDDAQKLSNEMLEGIRLLSNLETDTEKLLQIVLIGEPDLETKLDQPKLWQLKQRLVMRCRLSPLSSAEVGPYIDSRLRIAGYAGGGPFDAKAVEAIATYARGIPRLINVICDSALAMACAASKKEISAQMIDEIARALQLQNEIESTTEAPQTPVEPEAREEDRTTASDSENTDTPDEAWRAQPMGLAAREDVTKARVPFAPRRSAVGVGTLLGVVLLAAAYLLFYSHAIGNSLWKLPGKLTDEPGVRTTWLQANEVSAPQVGSKNPNDGVHLHVPPSERFSGSTEVASPHRTPASEQKNNSESKTEVRAPAVEKKAAKIVPPDDPPAERFEPEAVLQQAKPATQHPEKNSSNERRTSRESFFEVVDISFIRDKPQSDAEIIAALRPGTWVKLISRRGEYFQVLSLNDGGVSGYVHREDAFFEPLRVSLPPGDRR